MHKATRMKTTPTRSPPNKVAMVIYQWDKKAIGVIGYKPMN